MTQAQTPAKFPWLALAGIVVLALAGVVLLGLMAASLARAPGEAGPATTPALASTDLPGAALTGTVGSGAGLLPTTTPAPPTGTATASPTPAPTDLPTETAVPVMLTIQLPANVRSGPGLNYPILGGLDTGTAVQATGRDAGAEWFTVPFEAAPGGVGWVSVLVITVAGDAQSLPVVESEPAPATAPASAAQATVAPAAATATTGPAPATATSPPPLGSRGIVANYFRVRNTTVAKGQDIWFEFQVVNTAPADVQFAVLAAHTDVGFTAQSWTNETLSPQETLTWDDHLNIGTPGSYQVYLGICYGLRDSCLAGTNPWDRLSNSVTVTVTE
jgi:uncharacterized protein YraI